MSEANEKKDLAFYQAHPERYKILKNGAVYDRDVGRSVDLIPELNPYSITKENAREFHDRKRQIAQMGVLRGLARAVGIDVDEATLEQIAAGSGTAVENMAQHQYETFMKSTNIRGQAEAFRALVALGFGEEQVRAAPVPEVDHSQLAAFVEELRKAIEPQAVDGKVVE